MDIPIYKRTNENKWQQYHFPMYKETSKLALWISLSLPLLVEMLQSYLCLNLKKIAEYAGEVISEAYELEYGTDCLEMHVGAVEAGERAVIIDDLVATGGTLSAAIKLLGNLPFLVHRIFLFRHVQFYLI